MASGCPPPETLLTLVHEVTVFQDGQLRDDASLILVSWRPHPFG